ncbi:MAG: TrkH family potassium uptake protein [Clostridia bacterium]|nr:TrkH family potassium uptake protein [Clostridia bacterium]
MNKRMIAYILGILLLCEAGLMLLPTIVSLVYGEAVVISFLATIVLLVATGVVLVAMKPKNKTIYARHGLVIVALGWILMSLFGALPFFFSGEIPNYLDALFEAVSGFTTTGSSILTDVEALSKSMLFWRSFTHWIGGMGVLVFMMAVLPLAGGGGDLHLMKAESPGPNVSKLVPRSSKTARILYEIYLALTVLEIFILLFGGMSLFESVTIAFGTAGTGGFGVLNSSIASYSTFCQSTITVFMILFGINFNIYFLLLCKKFKDALKSEEVWTYLAIMFSAIVVIALNIRDMFASFSEAFHHSAFQVSSVMTTTGFATADFNQWPELSRIIMLGVMCVGACAGSTGGGLKVSRLIILLKSARREFRRISHPRSVKIITFDGNRLSDDTIRNTFAYFFIYVMIFAASVLVVSLDNFDFTTTVTSVIATLNNIGPGLNMVGATGNYSEFSFLSKLVLISDMLLGRLEIFPLLFLFAPSKQKVKIFSKIRSKF